MDEIVKKKKVTSINVCMLAIKFNRFELHS